MRQGDQYDDRVANEFVHEYVKSITAAIIILPTTVVYFLLMLDGSIISVAIPAIITEFDSLLDLAKKTYIDIITGFCSDDYSPDKVGRSQF